VTSAINLVGSNTNNIIYGNDVMQGFSGNDVYYVDSAGDTVIEAAGGGSDTLYTSVSYALAAASDVEVLSTISPGATTAINLTGSGIANTIYGNAGDNVLDGRGGNDILQGFGGADTYAFGSPLGAGNVDTILGYNVADDTIRLDDAIFTGLATGTLAAGAFHTGAAAGDADDRIIYNSATGALLFDPDGTGAGAAIQFATLNPGLVMTASEFVVV
jgi:serralysin